MLLMLIATPAFARDALFSVPTSQDYTVTGSSTLEVIFDQPGDWIRIQNHCASDVSFILNPKASQGAGYVTPDFYLRLATDEVFEGWFRVFSVGASTDAGGATNCTFSVIIGKH